MHIFGISGKKYVGAMFDTLKIIMVPEIQSKGHLGTNSSSTCENDTTNSLQLLLSGIFFFHLV